MSTEFFTRDSRYAQGGDSATMKNGVGADASRMRRAEARIRARIEEFRPLHAGSADVLDAEIDAWGEGWHLDDDKAHGDYVAQLDKQIANAQGQLAANNKELANRVKAQEKADRDYRDSRARLGIVDPSECAVPAPATADEFLPTDAPVPVLRGDTAVRPLNVPVPSSPPQSRPPRIGWYANPRLVLGEDFLARAMRWGCVVVAGCGEAPAIWGAIARILRIAGPAVVTLVSVAFTVAALLLAHLIGSCMRQKRSADPTASWSLLWAGLVGWLALGAASFLARLYYPVSTRSIGGARFRVPSVSTLSDGSLPEALIFGLLYLAGGVLAVFVSYVAFNPDARACRRAFSTKAKAAQEEKEAERIVVISRVLLRARENEKEGAPTRRAALRHKAEKDLESLKKYARTLIETALRNPRPPVSRSAGNPG